MASSPSVHVHAGGGGGKFLQVIRSMLLVKSCPPRVFKTGVCKIMSGVAAARGNSGGVSDPVIVAAIQDSWPPSHHH